MYQLDVNDLRNAMKEGLSYFTGCDGAVSIYAEDTVVASIDIVVNNDVLGVLEIWAYTNSSSCTIVFNGRHPHDREEFFFNTSIDTAKYFTKIDSTYVHKNLLDDEEHMTRLMELYANHLLNA